MKLPWSKSAPTPEPAITTTTPAVVDRDPNAPKGRPTPKQKGTRRPVEPPPKTGKEARARARAKIKEERAQGISRPKERAPREERVHPRDEGPERALVRDLVDSRRGFSSFFPLFAIVVVVVMFTGLQDSNPQAYNAISYAWLAFFIIMAFESIWLGRKVMARVRKDFPNTTQRPGSLKYYAIMRNLMFRKGRYPKPVVEIGDEV